MKILSVNVGQPKVLKWKGREIKTAIVKTPVEGPVKIVWKKLEGDVQVDRLFHGGRNKAVYSYAFEHYAWWKDKLPRDDWPLGLFGENLTTEGFDDTSIEFGDRFRFGKAVLEAVSYRQPCKSFAATMGSSMAPKIMKQAKRFGIYYRVIEEGDVRAGDPIEKI